MLYVLIIVANAHNSVTVSQHEYSNKDTCEAAAIVIHQAAKEVRAWINASNIQTRCVVK